MGRLEDEAARENARRSRVMARGDFVDDDLERVAELIVADMEQAENGKEPPTP